MIGWPGLRTNKHVRGRRRPGWVHGNRGLTRRGLIGAGSFALAAGLVGFPKPALVQTRRKVTLVYGVQHMDPNVAFISSIPLGVGFFAEEGLDVEVLSANGASTAVNMLAAGQAQFTTHGNGGLFAGVGRGVPFKAFICQVPDNFFSLAVEQDSPIKSVSDLKGVTVGVPSLGGGTLLMMKAVARTAGLSEQNGDIEYLGVGGGLPALDALKRKRVQALFLWDTPYSLFEAKGEKLRHMSPDPLPSLGFTHVTTASNEILDKDPALAAAMGRALSKSVVFMVAVQPEELAKLHYKLYPSSKPLSVTDAETLRIERVRITARVGYMRAPQRVFSRTENIGDETNERILKVRDLLFEGGEIKEALPLDRYFTRRYVEEMNKIDVAAVIEKARAFRV